MRIRSSEPINDGLLFGAIEDDFMGASDLASRLSEQGLRTLQVFGLPAEEFIDKLSGQYDAVVISLKSRSIAREAACEWSRLAIDRLRRLKAKLALKSGNFGSPDFFLRALAQLN